MLSGIPTQQMEIPVRAPDFNDFLILAGLSTLGAGLWMVAPWVALVVLGGILAGLGLFGAYSEGRAAAAEKREQELRDQRGE